MSRRRPDATSKLDGYELNSERGRRKATISRTRRVMAMLAASAVTAVVFLMAVDVAASVAVPPSGNWTQTLNEEFSANGLNTALWTPEWWQGGDMNGQCTSPSLVSQPGNGYLYLQVRAQESTCGGTKHPDTGALVESDPADGKPGHSGFLYSYGYVEWRVYVVGWGGEPECPRGGCIPDWPALWSFPENEETEFDVFEGLKGEACHGFWHHVEPIYHEGGCETASYAGWHTYGAEWEPGNLKYYYDGTKVWEYSSSYIKSTPQYLIMNDVPPGSYGGKLVVPDEILVDYVRVWQHYPTVTNEAASEIQQTSAKLNGQVNPNGLDTHYYFEYGPTTSYGTRIPAGEGMDIGGGTSTIYTWNNVSGLAPGTLYHYRLVASNATGTTYGSDQTFYTPGPPRAVTEAATGVKPTEATLNGSVNPNTYATNYYFQYGPTTSYGSIVPTGGAGVGSGTTPVPLSNTITGLAPGSPYHYRIVAENYNGEWGYGEDRTFNTPVARTNVFFPDSNHGDTMTDRWYSGGWFETNFGGGEMAKGTAASGVMVGGAANVFFVNAGESDKMADWWTSPTGWLQTNFGGDEIEKGSSPFVLMVESEPNVFFVDAKEHNTIADWYSHDGWNQAPFGGDEVAAGTSPSGVMIGTHEPNVFFVDAKEHNTITDRWYHDGWNQSHLGKDEVAQGTSPSAVVAGNEENVFFVDASKGDTLTDLQYVPGVGWQESNLGGHEVAKGTSPFALMVGSEANVFFVDAKEKDTLTDWWYHEGWKQSPFDGDEVAAGTSPSGVMVGSEPNVFFVDAKEKDTLTDWWYHEGWRQSPFGGDAVAAGSSPSALEE
jgi:hypothetical protein